MACRARSGCQDTLLCDPADGVCPCVEQLESSPSGREVPLLLSFSGSFSVPDCWPQGWYTSGPQNHKLHWPERRAGPLPWSQCRLGCREQLCAGDVCRPHAVCAGATFPRPAMGICPAYGQLRGLRGPRNGIRGMRVSTNHHGAGCQADEASALCSTGVHTVWAGASLGGPDRGIKGGVLERKAV